MEVAQNNILKYPLKYAFLVRNFIKNLPPNKLDQGVATLLESKCLDYYKNILGEGAKETLDCYLELSKIYKNIDKTKSRADLLKWAKSSNDTKKVL